MHTLKHLRPKYFYNMIMIFLHYYNMTIRVSDNDLLSASTKYYTKRNNMFQVTMVITGHNHPPRADEYPDNQEEFSSHPLNAPNVSAHHHRPRKHLFGDNGDGWIFTKL